MQPINPEEEENHSNSSALIPGITSSEGWRTAFGKLSAGCLSDSRAVILIGDRGVGKSSLIETWKTQSRVAFNIIELNDATGEPDLVVANLAGLMGVDTADLGRGAILAAMKSSVERTRAEGRETVVIIHDADDVPPNTIELLMILSRDRSEPRPLMRYIISGTESLRTSMRLDGGSVKRQNYVIVNLEPLTADQTKAFVATNLARDSDVTISDDAAEYLHESTNGAPRNILSLLNKAKDGSASYEQSEITRKHIKAMIGASRASDSPVPNPFTQSANGKGPEEGPAPEASKGPETISAKPDVSGEADSDDPRHLLRWAFGVEQHSETEALSQKAEASVAARKDAPSLVKESLVPTPTPTPMPSGPNSGNAPPELNEALARVAAREAAERNPQANPTPAKAPEPLVARRDEAVVVPMDPPASSSSPASSGPGEGTLEHMIGSESFAFDQDRTEKISGPVRDPNKLKKALSDIPEQPRPGKTRKFLLATGVLVLGVASLGVLWTALKPTDVDGSGGQVATLDGTNGTVAVPQAPESGVPTASSIATATVPVAPSQPTATLNTASSSDGGGADIPLIKGDEPDLATAIALLKSPSLDESWRSPSSLPQPNHAASPRIQSVAFLPPSEVGSPSENTIIRRAISADIREAERVGLAGDETRLLDEIKSLEATLQARKETLESLEQSITTMSSQGGEAVDGTALDDADVEIAKGRLAFMARDGVRAAQELEEATARASAVQAELASTREELAAAEAELAAANSKLEGVETGAAAIAQDYAETEVALSNLTNKVANVERELAARQSELDAVTSRQTQAEGLLADLEVELDAKKLSQTELESEIAQLVETREGQLKSSVDLDASIVAVGARLAAAQNDLSAADAALAERTSRLSELEGATSQAQQQLDALVATLAERSQEVETSTQELSDIRASQDALVQALDEKSAAVDAASAQLAELENNKQTASSEFEDLLAQREVLRSDIANGRTSLEGLSEELSQKQASLDSLVASLADGSNEIAAQTVALENLKAENSDVATLQNQAQQRVDDERIAVASVSGELENLTAQKTSLEALVDDIKSQKATAEDQLKLVISSKTSAEQEIAQTQARLADIRSQEETAKTALASFSDEYQAKTGELAELEARILASSKQLEEVTAKQVVVNKRLAASTTEGTEKLQSQREELARLTDELEAKRVALTELTEEVEQRQSALAGLQPVLDSPVAPVTEEDGSGTDLASVVVPPVRDASRATVVDAVPEVDVSVEPGISSGSGGTREEALVVSAISEAPGLGRVGQEKKDELQAALVRGDCVSDALKATFGRVNPHTLVALLKNMEMCGS